MLSRVADSLYWMSRYLERAEHTARLIEVDLQLRLDQSPESGAGRWLRLLDALQTHAPQDARIDPASITQLLTLDRTNPSSILSCVAAARENLRQVREQCSSEMWEQLNRLYLQVSNTSKSEERIFFRASPSPRWRTVKAGSTFNSVDMWSVPTRSQGSSARTLEFWRIRRIRPSRLKSIWSG